MYKIINASNVNKTVSPTASPASKELGNTKVNQDKVSVTSGSSGTIPTAIKRALKTVNPNCRELPTHSATVPSSKLPASMRETISTQLPQPMQSLRTGEAAPPGKKAILICIAGKPVLVAATPQPSVYSKPTYSVDFTDGSVVEMERSHSDFPDGELYRPTSRSQKVHPALCHALPGGADVDIEQVIDELLRKEGLQRNDLSREQMAFLQNTIQTSRDEKIQVDMQVDMQVADAFLDLTDAGDEDGQALFVSLTSDPNLIATVAQLRVAIRGEDEDELAYVGYDFNDDLEVGESSMNLDPARASFSTAGTVPSNTIDPTWLNAAKTEVDKLLLGRNISRVSLSDSQYARFVRVWHKTPTSFRRQKLEEAIRQHVAQDFIDHYHTQKAIIRKNYQITPGIPNAQQPMYYPHFTINGPGTPDDKGNTFYRPKLRMDQSNCSVHSINAMFGCEMITDAEVLQYAIELTESDQETQLTVEKRGELKIRVEQVGVEPAMMCRILKLKKNLPVELFQINPQRDADGNRHFDANQLTFLDGVDRIALRMEHLGGGSQWVAFRGDSLLDSRRLQPAQADIAVSQYVLQKNAQGISAIILERGARITAGGGNATAERSTSVTLSQSREPVALGSFLRKGLAYGTNKAKTPIKDLQSRLFPDNNTVDAATKFVEDIINTGVPQTDRNLPGNLAVFHKSFELEEGKQETVKLIAKYENGTVVDVNIDDHGGESRKRMINGRKAKPTRVATNIYNYLRPGSYQHVKREITKLWNDMGGEFGEYERPIDLVLGIIDHGIKVLDRDLPEEQTLYHIRFTLPDGSEKSVRLLVTFDQGGVVTDADIEHAQDVHADAQENSEMIDNMGWSAGNGSQAGATMIYRLKNRLNGTDKSHQPEMKGLVRRLNDNGIFAGKADELVREVVDIGVRRNDPALRPNFRRYERTYGGTNVDLIVKYGNDGKVEDVGLNNAKQRKRMRSDLPGVVQSTDTGRVRRRKRYIPDSVTVGGGTSGRTSAINTRAPLSSTSTTRTSATSTNATRITATDLVDGILTQTGGGIGALQLLEADLVALRAMAQDSIDTAYDNPTSPPMSDAQILALLTADPGLQTEFAAAVIRAKALSADLWNGYLSASAWLDAQDVLNSGGDDQEMNADDSAEDANRRTEGQ